MSPTQHVARTLGDDFQGVEPRGNFLKGRLEQRNFPEGRPEHTRFTEMLNHKGLGAKGCQIVRGATWSCLGIFSGLNLRGARSMALGYRLFFSRGGPDAQLAAYLCHRPHRHPAAHLRRCHLGSCRQSHIWSHVSSMMPVLQNPLLCQGPRPRHRSRVKTWLQGAHHSACHMSAHKSSKQQLMAGCKQSGPACQLAF